MDIFPVDWVKCELETSFEIRCFGKLLDGASACVRITFLPHFYVECPPSWNGITAQQLITAVVEKYGAIAKHCVSTSRKSIWGFTNGQPRRFIRLVFSTVAASRKAKWFVANTKKLRTYEASVDNVIKLFHIRDIAPAQWIRVNAFSTVHEERKVTVADIEVTTTYTEVSPATDVTAIPPLVFASWDIECVSESGGFPLADKPHDVICTICTTFQRYGETRPFSRHAVTLGSCDDVTGVDIVRCDTEADVINAWLEALHQHSADVLIGWNTFGFDYKYVYGRSLVCVDDLDASPLVHLNRFGRSVEGGGDISEKKLSSAAYGDNNFFFLAAPGWLHLDLMVLIKKQYKLDSYSLNHVSAKFLGDQKIDLKPHEIFQKFRGSASDRAMIVEYCSQDVSLPLRLMTKLSIAQNVLEMANATSVPVLYLVTHGQQIKVLSLLLKKARSMNFLCPDTDFSAKSNDDDEEGYQGATVLDAQCGAYLHDCVSALDFASLYPSIIRAHNLCTSTLVLDARYGAIPGVEYYSVETPKGTYSFAQNVESVLPALLDDLAIMRKKAKKAEADAKDRGEEFEASVQNARQLAFKVSMNSAYGFYGATKGFLPCLPLAASTTTIGRHMISHTKDLAESLVPGSKVIYGDSVAGYTPLLVRRDGNVHFLTIEELSESRAWTRMSDGKESIELSGMDTYTEVGWTRVHRIVRHRMNPKNRMVRVLTHAGLVDVTMDHSLLLEDGKPVRPTELCLNSSLMHFPGRMPLDDDGHPCSEKEAYIWGCLLAQGWTDKARLIVGATRELKQAFWNGLRESCPTKELTVRNQLIAAIVLAIGDALDEPVSIDYSYQFSYIVSFVSHREPGIRKLERLPEIPIQYVYDLTTENHHFAAGIGRLVVHNTDSVLVIFNCGEENRTNVVAHFEIAQVVADTITKEFRHPNQLEFEKVYHPYILFSKKRYAGMLYSKPEKPDYMDVKGIQLVRRDNCPLVRTASSEILHAIMEHKNADLAIQVANKHVVGLLRNEVPLDELVISKALRADYKNPDSLPHVQVARKIHQRRGYPVQSGERVPFVFVDSGAETALGLQAVRAEDPEYVRENRISPDILYYIDSQLSTPIQMLLDILKPGTFQALMDSEDIKPLVDALRQKNKEDLTVAKRVRTNTKNKQQEITNFFFRS